MMMGIVFISRLNKKAVTREVKSIRLPTDPSVIRDDMPYIESTQNRTGNISRLAEVEDTKGNCTMTIFMQC